MGKHTKTLGGHPLIGEPPPDYAGRHRIGWLWAVRYHQHTAFRVKLR